MKESLTDKEKLSKSYDKLKIDYDLLYSTGEKQRKEINEENEKHRKIYNYRLAIFY